MLTNCNFVGERSLRSLVQWARRVTRGDIGTGRFQDGEQARPSGKDSKTKTRIIGGVLARDVRRYMSDLTWTMSTKLVNVGIKFKEGVSMPVAKRESFTRLKIWCVACRKELCSSNLKYLFSILGDRVQGIKSFSSKQL